MDDTYQITLNDLNTLIRNANNPDIPHMDALMRALFGNKASVIKLCKRLLRWLPHSKRADGAVYKSARQLAEETACSPKSVTRARKSLEAIGFEVFLKKAEGAPTNHYKLNSIVFREVLAQLFGVKPVQILLWMMPDATGQDVPIHSDTLSPANSAGTGQDVPNGLGHDDPMDSTQDVPIHSDIVAQTSTTKNDTQRETPIDNITNVADTDYQLVFTEKMRRRLNTTHSTVQTWVLKYGTDRVEEVIEQAEEMQREGRIRKSMVGWIHAALKGNYQWAETAAQKRKRENDPYRFIKGEDARFINH